jgi:N-glycosylase/DNA lyase
MRPMILSGKTTFTITPSSPFNFDGTFNKPSHYPTDLDHWEPGRYWETMRVGERLFGIRIRDRGTVSKPGIEVSIFYNGKISGEEKDAIGRELRWHFDLDADLSEFNAMVKRDKRFSHVFKRWVGTRISGTNLYDEMMIMVFLQNATIRRTVQMTNALLSKYGTRLRFDGKEIFAFWVPRDMEKVSEQELRDMKVGYRAKFIKRLSHDFVEGKIDGQELRRLDKEQAKKMLLGLYGVGPETAGTLLFGECHVYDTFDHIAPWQQKIYSMLFYNKKMVPVKRIQNDIKRQYGKYSMLAVHYIWEDIFWKRKTQHIPWLEKEIRL